jgi:hypothetical protein
MAEYLIILLLATGVCYGAYELKWLWLKNKLSQKASELTEDEVWQEYDKVSAEIYHSQPVTYTRPSKLICLKHNVLVAELERRDLLEYPPIKELRYAECLSEMSDILVYTNFVQCWDRLYKNTPHPRMAAIDYALARAELMKRYQNKYAKMQDDNLKEAYAVLSIKYQDTHIARGEYEEYLIAKAEMSKRHFKI